MDNLCIAQTRMFGETPLDIYQNESGALYMTRDQIGTALEYGVPNIAISNIHQRNPDRLDPLSLVTNLVTKVGNHTQQRQTYVYNLRGVMEICRLSRQPKADAFMDFTWDVMEGLHHGEVMLSSPDQQTAISTHAMQAKIDSLLELTQKILKDNIEIRNSLNYIKRGESTAVLSVPAASPNPAAKTAEPQSWQEEIKGKAKRITLAASRQYPNVRSVLRFVYQKMKREYGFVAEQIRHEYRTRHSGMVGYVSTLDSISENETWRDVFSSLFSDLYSEYVVPVATEHPDRVQKIAESLAQKLGDKSRNHCATYHRIYAGMEDCDWSEIRKAWRIKNGGSALPSKKSLLLKDDALFHSFTKSAEQIETISCKQRKDDHNA